MERVKLFNDVAGGFAQVHYVAVLGLLEFL
jgi:hypothetical protein